MLDWRGTEIKVDCTVVVIEKNRNYGQSGTHAAIGVVVRLAEKWPIVSIVERVGMSGRWYGTTDPRPMSIEKVTVVQLASENWGPGSFR